MARTELLRARLLPQARGLLSAGPVRPGRARRAPVAPACRRRGGQGPDRRSKKQQSQAKQASQDPISRRSGTELVEMQVQLNDASEDRRIKEADEKKKHEYKIKAIGFTLFFVLASVNKLVFNPGSGTDVLLAFAVPASDATFKLLSMDWENTL